jgi:hypothetical protein
MEEQLITKETAVLGESIGYPFYTYPNVPTQSLLQKWLREVHNIYVSTRESLAITGELEYVCTVNGKYINHGIKYKPINRFDTWEEALEIGLQEALKLIEIVKEK